MNQAELAEDAGVAASTIANYLNQLGAVVVSRRRGVVLDLAALHQADTEATLGRLDDHRRITHHLRSSWSGPMSSSGEMELLVEHRRRPTLQDFAALLGTNRSTAWSRLCRLEHEGLVRRDERGRLWLTPPALGGPDQRPPSTEMAAAPARREAPRIDATLDGGVLLLLRHALDTARIGIESGVETNDRELVRAALQICSDALCLLHGNVDPRVSVAQDPRDSIAQIAELRDESSRISSLSEKERSLLPTRDTENSFLSSSLNRESARTGARPKLADRPKHPEGPVKAPAGEGATAQGLEEVLAPLMEKCRRLRKPLLDDRGRGILGQLSEAQLREGLHRASVRLDAAPHKIDSPFGMVIRWAEDGRWDQFTPPAPTTGTPRSASSDPTPPVDSELRDAAAQLDVLERDPKKAPELADLDRAMEQEDEALHPFAGRARRLGGQASLHERRLAYLAGRLRRTRAHPPQAERTSTSA